MLPGYPDHGKARLLLILADFLELLLALHSVILPAFGHQPSLHVLGAMNSTIDASLQASSHELALPYSLLGLSTMSSFDPCHN
eukprot:scaffold20454_cov40-Cyclotella_meneghiniana.AAC.2